MRPTALLPRLLAGVGVMLFASVGVCADATASPSTAALLQALDRGVMERGLWKDASRSPSVEVRRLAAEVLASAADPESLRRLRQLADDPDPEVQRTVMLAAGRIGRPADRIAARGLASGSAAVREAAAWAACHTGGIAVAPLLDLLQKETDAQVLATALANLWRLDTAWQARTERFVHHDDLGLRRALAYSLARAKGPARLPFLRHLTSDREAEVRALVVRGLRGAEVGESDLALALARLGDPDSRVLISACQALEGSPDLKLTTAATAPLRALLESPEPHVAAAALRAAGAHPELDLTSDLEAMVANHAEPWLAAEALLALARRGAPSAVSTAGEWVADSELWRRKAAAAALPRLLEEAAAKLQPAVLAAPEPSVRLAWLEALTPEDAKLQVVALRRLVDTDPDPAVRAQALELLRGAGQAGSVVELLELARRWAGDPTGDARSTALTAALAAGPGRERQRALAAALADPDPAVRAAVLNAAREAGLEAAAPARPLRHDTAWYEELAAWAAEPRWLDVVTVRGAFRIRLDAAAAPISAREIWDLAEKKLYDGLLFHRVVPGFVVQWGDPRGDGWGGPGFVLPDEPSLTPFDAYRVGIATSGPGTGGSQLFVTLAPAEHLTGHYTNLGGVVFGREVLTRLRAGDKILRVRTQAGASPPLPPPTLLGTLEWSDLEPIAGWGEEAAAYMPEAAAVEKLRTAIGSYQVIAVLGTWCGDSEREIPRLHRVLQAVGGDHFSMWLIGVDRTKRVSEPGFPAGLLPDKVPERVPMIFLLDSSGNELGRVVETAERPLELLLVEWLTPVEGW